MILPQGVCQLQYARVVHDKSDDELFGLGARSDQVDECQDLGRGGLAENARDAESSDAFVVGGDEADEVAETFQCIGGCHRSVSISFISMR